MPLWHINELEGKKDPTRNYEILKKEGVVDGWSRYNNDVPIGERPIFVESNGTERLSEREIRLVMKDEAAKESLLKKPSAPEAGIVSLVLAE